jgi:hypothetical protein
VILRFLPEQAKPKETEGVLRYLVATLPEAKVAGSLFLARAPRQVLPATSTSMVEVLRQAAVVQYPCELGRVNKMAARSC